MKEPCDRATLIFISTALHNHSISLVKDSVVNWEREIFVRSCDCSLYMSCMHVWKTWNLEMESGNRTISGQLNE